MNRSKKRFIWMFILGSIITYLLDFLLKDYEIRPERNRFRFIYVYTDYDLNLGREFKT